jgi:hypothetical protein
MHADIAWNAHRLAVLRNLLGRWIAELPAMKVVPERARAQEQAIADLKQMIESIEAELGAYLGPAVIHPVRHRTYAPRTASS